MNGKKTHTQWDGHDSLPVRRRRSKTITITSVRGYNTTVQYGTRSGTGPLIRNRNPCGDNSIFISDDANILKFFVYKRHPRIGVSYLRRRGMVIKHPRLRSEKVIATKPSEELD